MINNKNLTLQKITSGNNFDPIFAEKTSFWLT